MRTIISKYPGTCRVCEGRINKGEEIQYHGKGQGITCIECVDNGRDAEARTEEAFGLEPGTMESDRRLARQGLTVVRFSSGESFTQNSRGRCEDAPCCGCCS